MNIALLPYNEKSSAAQVVLMVKWLLTASVKYLTVLPIHCDDTPAC